MADRTFLNRTREGSGLVPSAVKLRHIDLAEHGYVEGKNLIIEQQFADCRYDLMPKLAAELVSNVKTAKALGLTVSPSLLGRPGELIE